LISRGNGTLYLGTKDTAEVSLFTKNISRFSISADGYATFVNRPNAPNYNITAFDTINDNNATPKWYVDSLISNITIGTDLSTSYSTLYVEINSSSGTSAAIQSAQSDRAGVMSATSYNRLQTAYNHTSNTSNPHNVTASQIGALTAVPVSSSSVVGGVRQGYQNVGGFVIEGDGDMYMSDYYLTSSTPTLSSAIGFSLGGINFKCTVEDMLALGGGVGSSSNGEILFNDNGAVGGEPAIMVGSDENLIVSENGHYPPVDEYNFMTVDRSLGLYSIAINEHNATRRIGGGTGGSSSTSWDLPTNSVFSGKISAMFYNKTQGYYQYVEKFFKMIDGANAINIEESRYGDSEIDLCDISIIGAGESWDTSFNVDVELSSDTTIVSVDVVGVIVSY
jgi:hypothetical protein